MTFPFIYILNIGNKNCPTLTTEWGILIDFAEAIR